MNTLQIAVILMCGYIYVTNSLSDRYKFKRSSGWDAYFFVAVWGIVFVVIAWLGCSLMSFLGFFRWLSNAVGITPQKIARMFPVTNGDSSINFRDLKLFVWAFTSITMATLAGFAKRWWLTKPDRHISVLAKITSTNALEAMLMEASVSQFPVLVSLKSKKVYVGIVSCPAFEHGDYEVVELLPLLSGYRDKDTLQVRFTSNYQSHYIRQGIGIVGTMSRLTLDDFRTLLPKREIDNVSFFDIETYKKFQEIENSAPPDGESTNKEN
ncbi:hypothetical protein [Enterobacter hormaechei]|uniref:hypothetical protein n=1 Tax=Enterobacter hormaechei TaxID=158836 RepID=UPI00301D4891